MFLENSEQGANANEEFVPSYDTSYNEKVGRTGGTERGGDTPDSVVPILWKVRMSVLCDLLIITKKP